MSFATTVDLRLQPSVRLLKWLSTLHVLALFSLPFAMQQGAAMGALIAAFAASWLWLRRHPALGFGRRALVRITWQADDSWTLHQADGRQFTARLRGDSLRHPAMLVLRYQLHEGGVRTRVLAGDEADSDGLRRLRARLSVWTPDATDRAAPPSP